MSKPDALSDVSLERISSIMGWLILRWSSACRHDRESVKIKNYYIRHLYVSGEQVSTAMSTMIVVDSSVS